MVNKYRGGVGEEVGGAGVGDGEVGGAEEEGAEVCEFGKAA